MLPDRSLSARRHGFDTERHSPGGIELVIVRGDLDLATAPILSTVLNDAVWKGDGAVVVDLSRVGFMDSTGLHLLLNAVRRLTRAGRALELVCEGDGVLRTIRAARLESTFRVHATREGALAVARGLGAIAS